MTPHRRMGKIPDREWERFGPIATDLYHKRGMPLSSDKQDNVVDTMRRDHQFFATPAQYESFLRKRSTPKNLKTHEWRQVIEIIDRLALRGEKTQVKVSGHVMSQERIKRARRHVKCRPETMEGLPELDSTRVQVEIQGPNNIWTTYKATQDQPNHDTDTQTRADYIDDHGLAPNEAANIPIEVSETIDTLSASEFAFVPLATDEQQPAAIGSLDAFNIPTLVPNQEQALYSPGFLSFLNIPGTCSPPLGVCFGHCWFDGCPFLQIPSSLLQTPGNSLQTTVRSREHRTISNGQDPAMAESSSTTPQRLVVSLLRNAMQLHNDQPDMWGHVELPLAEDIWDNLTSLLPDLPSDSGSDSAELVPRQASAVDRAFLFSIANNFAGLEQVPLPCILQAVKDQLSSRLFESLQQWPKTLLKSLIHNLFQAAVTANDTSTALFLLRNEMIKIDPNEIICIFNGTRLTPVEITAKFRNLELTSALLEAGAHANKVYSPRADADAGTLELAVGMSRPYQPVPLELVRVLLRHHAKVRVTLFNLALCREETELVRELLPHVDFSNSQEVIWYLPSFAWYLDESNSLPIAMKILENDGFKFAPESSPYASDLTRALVFAVSKGHRELVRYLLKFNTDRNVALAEAVRSKNSDMVDFMLHNGATVDSPPSWWSSSGIGIFVCPNTRPKAFGSAGFVTPLAEAIRVQNRYFFRLFEDKSGTWRLAGDESFDIAMRAAAEIGDLQTTQWLLQRGPTNPGERTLGDALSIAIRHRHLAYALELLDIGATNGISLDNWHLPSSPLVGALLHRSRVLIDAILDCDLSVSGRGNDEPSCLEAAVSWGDISIVKTLLSMGTAVNTGWNKSPLAIAVEANDVDMVEILLKHAASPNYRPIGGQSALEVSIHSIGDHMLRMLLHVGAADPADSKTFLAAIQRNHEALELLLNAFTSRYPAGIKGFGAELLLKAIEMNDKALIQALLNAKMDVHSFAKREEDREDREVTKKILKTMASLQAVADADLITPLGFAIRRRDIKVIRQLLSTQCDADVFATQTSRDDPLPAGPRETVMCLAVESRNISIVELLLQKGVRLNRPAKYGVKRTPLQKACETGSFEMVEYLLGKGADINAPPALRSGGTALQMAARSGSIKIVSLLLDRGADVFAPTSKYQGYLPLEAAAATGRIDMLRVLWNATLGLGFNHEQVERAKHLARKQCHWGCVDYLTEMALNNLGGPILPGPQGIEARDPGSERVDQRGATGLSEHLRNHCLATGLDVARQV